VLGRDAQAPQLLLEGTGDSVAFLSAEDEAVEFLSDVKRLRL